MIEREKVIKGLECCLHPFDLACEECPYHDPDGTGSICEQLEKDALELLTGQEPKQPEKIETGKMKICGLRSEAKPEGRFNNGPELAGKWMTYTWRDISTGERQELSMNVETWIHFSKEITEAVARFEMEG